MRRLSGNLALAKGGVKPTAWRARGEIEAAGKKSVIGEGKEETAEGFSAPAGAGAPVGGRGGGRMVSRRYGEGEE